MRSTSEGERGANRFPAWPWRLCGAIAQAFAHNTPSAGLYASVDSLFLRSPCLPHLHTRSSKRGDRSTTRNGSHIRSTAAGRSCEAASTIRKRNVDVGRRTPEPASRLPPELRRDRRGGGNFHPWSEYFIRIIQRLAQNVGICLRWESSALTSLDPISGRIEGPTNSDSHVTAPL